MESRNAVICRLASRRLAGGNAYKSQKDGVCDLLRYKGKIAPPGRIFFYEFPSNYFHTSPKVANKMIIRNNISPKAVGWILRGAQNDGKGSGHLHLEALGDLQELSDGGLVVALPQMHIDECRAVGIVERVNIHTCLAKLIEYAGEGIGRNG